MNCLNFKKLLSFVLAINYEYNVTESRESFTSAAYLNPPPAAVRRFAPTSNARRSQTLNKKEKICPKDRSVVAEAGLEPTTFGFISQGCALLAPQKHSRHARLERFALLLVSSPHYARFIVHRTRSQLRPTALHPDRYCI